jgi:dTDP-4-amino-4,6-dideoxygalactose transaminase
MEKQVLAKRDSWDTVEPSWGSGDLAAFKRAGTDEIEEFRKSFSKLAGFEDDHLSLWPSARAALKHVFRSLLEKSNSSEVVLPAFTCPVVSEVALAAGCRVTLYDQSSVFGLVDWAGLTSRLDSGPPPLAVVVTHLFGAPTDFRPILENCRNRGTAVIEDCSHCVGGSIGGNPVGTLGDFAVFSFNYDKPITLGWGGALATPGRPAPPGPSATLNAEMEFRALEDLVKFYAQRRSQLVGNHSVATFAKKISSRIGRGRQPRIGKYSPALSETQLGVGPVRAALGLLQIERYPSTLRLRNENARFLASILPYASTWNTDESVSTAWIKMKVLFENSSQADNVAAQAQKFGYRLGRFNWPTTGAPSVGLYPHADGIAKCALDVPVHQSLSFADIRAIAMIIEDEADSVA